MGVIMEKIYSFTNEFVRAYPEMYDFNDAKVENFYLLK